MICIRSIVATLTAGLALTVHAAPAALQEVSIAKLPLDRFCLDLGKALRNPTVENMHYRKAMLDRAYKQEGITFDMLTGIETGRPVMGLNECGLLAALGRPSRTNTTTTRAGVHHQVIYGQRGLYIYMDNSAVTAWQE